MPPPEEPAEMEKSAHSVTCIFNTTKTSHLSQSLQHSQNLDISLYINQSILTSSMCVTVCMYLGQLSTVCQERVETGPGFPYIRAAGVSGGGSDHLKSESAWEYHTADRISQAGVYFTAVVTAAVIALAVVVVLAFWQRGLVSECGALVFGSFQLQCRFGDCCQAQDVSRPAARPDASACGL